MYMYLNENEKKRLYKCDSLISSPTVLQSYITYGDWTLMKKEGHQKFEILSSNFRWTQKANGAGRAPNLS